MYTNMHILLVYVYFLFGIFSSGEKNESTFVPTREWQVVKTGTPIPGGLHVRHNFQTGVTEAKLMDKEEVEYDSPKNSSDNSKTELWAVHPDNSLLQSNGDKSTQITSDNINQRMKFSIDELKARLKNIKQNNIKSHSSVEQKEEKSYQNYSELNRKFENLSINVINDAELLNMYFQQFDAYRNSIVRGTLTVSDTEKVLDILSNLEYLIHQIDNAHMFTDLNGISLIILPCVNGTNIEIKAEALRLLGAAAQSNPKVQTKALESELVQKLLYILSTNNGQEIKARCLFALSALVRHFPAAQKSLIDHGGSEIFGKILTDNQMQIQLKVLKLINDLAIERQDLKRIDNPEERQKKENDYLTTHFEEKLLLHNYCDQLNSLFIGKYAQLDQFNSEQYDFLETICESVLIFHPMCKDKYQNDKNNFVNTINNIIQLCKNLMNTADADEVDRLKDLQLILAQLRARIVHVNDVSRDEL